MSSINKNPANIQTVDFSKHAKVKIKSSPGHDHAKDSNMVAINLSELGSCASNFPIAFIQNPQDNKYLLVALLGLRSGENIFYGQDFWSCAYVPLAIQRHPFVIGYDDRLPNGEEITTCLEMDSPLINEKEGHALFDESGNSSEFLTNRHQLLNRIFSGEQLSGKFIERLTELELLTPLVVALQKQDSEVRRVGGLFTIDETRLLKLSAEQLKELQTEAFLPPCYLILGSLYQLNNLIRKRNLKNGEQIINFKIEFGSPAAENQAAVAT